MKRIIFLSMFLLFIYGCGAVRLGTYIDSKVLPNYQVSAERIKAMAPQFKANWKYISGFIQGSSYYDLKAPKIIRDAMGKLDALHEKAVGGSWTEKEQGEMAVLILQFEYESRKYLYEEYGATVITLIKQIAGI